jgi:hypothetical protein
MSLPVSVSTTEDVLLRAGGKVWGKLISGRFLEIRKGGQCVRFDLARTAIEGRPILAPVLIEPQGDCKDRTDVLD